jgi:hypothetical chaperone protein
MAEPLAYAIDFGTSNSSIAVAYPERVDVLEVDPIASVPQSLASILYLHRGGGRSAGEDAVRQFLVTGSSRTTCTRCELVEICRTHVRGGFCMDARLMTGLKSHMADELRTTHSWGVDFSMSDRIASILRTMKSRADRVTGRDVRRAVLGHPVVFEGAEGPRFTELQALAEETLLDAARFAGFEEVHLMPEPSAAVIDEPMHSGTALAVDFGGGTFDVAIIEFRPDEANVTGLQGVAVGGERFDAMLFDHFVASELGLTDRYQIASAKTPLAPRYLRKHLRTMSGTAWLLGQRETARILREFRSAPGGERLAPVEALLFGGQAYALHKAIERAKMELSEKDEAFIRLERPGIRLNVKVTEPEFAHLLEADLDKIEASIHAAMRQAGVQPEGVDLVIRTGGSSRIASFQRLLQRKFGPDKVQERHLFNTVVSGLGTQARRLWAA